MPAASLTASAEFQINGITPNHQHRPATVGLADGGFVAVWQADDVYGEGNIRAQRFGADGAPVGGEVPVNTVSEGHQGTPVVGALADGGFVVAWWTQTGGTVRAQRFGNNGTRIDGEITLVADANPASFAPIQITGLADGGYALAWEGPDGDGSDGILVQRFNANGTAVGLRQSPATLTADSQTVPTLAALADGGYVVVWQSHLGETGGGSSGWGIKGQRFDAAGHKVGDEFQANTTAAGHQLEASTAALADGGFVVAWRSHHGDDGWGDIYTQRFDAAGAKVGDEVRVNSHTADFQGKPDVVGLTDGGFVIAWQSLGQDGTGFGVHAQHYDATGTPLDGEFRLNEYTAGDQIDAVLAARPDGGFTAVWTSHGQDGDGAGVFGRSYVTRQEIRGTDGDDTLTGTARNETILGLDGNDHLSGRGGVDWLYGGQGEDVLSGGAGADLIFGGTDTTDGRDDLDTASYEGSAGGVYVNLAERRGLQADAKGDRLYGIERVIGSTFDDHLIGQETANAWGTYFDAARYLASNPDLRTKFGTDHARATEHWETTGHLEARHGAMMVGGSILVAGAGNDTVRGGSQDDYLLGGTGSDHLFGYSGHDWLYGETGEDNVNGGDGDDRLYGGDGGDWLTGGQGEDVLSGGAGADLIFGGSNITDGRDDLDTASYAGSIGGVHVNLAWGYGLQADAEDDTLAGIERVVGSAFDDHLIGQETVNAWGTYFDAARYLASNPDLRATFGTDHARATRHWETTGHLEARHGAMMVGGSILVAGAGNDTVHGGIHNDYLLGGTGNDRVHGQGGHDWLYGEAGDDTLDGGDHGDRLYGGEGDDTLDGGSGDDTLYGGAGNDRLTGRDYEDMLIGDAGADILEGGDDFDTASYAGSTGGVHVNLAEGRGLRADAEGDRLSGIERVVGSAFDDHLIGQETVNAWGTYFDAARYLAANEDLRTKFGTDFGAATRHWETAGHLEARHGAMMVGGSILAAGAGNDTVHGGGHNDYLLGGTGNDRVHGQGGHDWLYGEAGSDTLDGGDHGDRLYGGEGDDTLDGGSGDDRLYGGLGSDTVYGGHGYDLFLGTAAELIKDHIQDFARGDRLVVLDQDLSHLYGTKATSRIALGDDWWEYVSLSGPDLSTAQFRTYWDGNATTIWLV
ncbi:MAG TPA: hypothetical protein VEY95_07380 [Azospirillaceae bacterium]|nr:hypothetical protein [Azospirillaceae bacterium]